MKTNDIFSIADLTKLGFNCAKCNDFHSDVQITEDDLEDFSRCGCCLCNGFECPYCLSSLNLDGCWYFFPTDRLINCD